MRRELEPLQGPLACAAAVLLNFQHLLQVNRKYSCQTDDLHLKKKKKTAFQVSLDGSTEAFSSATPQNDI